MKYFEKNYYNFLFKDKAQNGFTLLEILVVIAIVGIVISATTVVFTRFNRQQNITIAQKNLMNDLAEAKSNANSHVVRNCTTGVLNGYRLEWRTSDDSYTLQEMCQMPTGETPLNVRTIRKRLPTDVNFVGDGSIRFNTLSSFNALSGGSPGGSIVISHPSVSNNITITVSTPEGVIELQ